MKPYIEPYNDFTDLWRRLGGAGVWVVCDNCVLGWNPCIRYHALPFSRLAPLTVDDIMMVCVCNRPSSSSRNVTVFYD